MDSIAAGTRDVNLGDIKTTLEELCKEGVLKLTTTKSGFDSYRLDGEMLETNIVSEDDDSDIEIKNWTLNTPENLENLLQQDIHNSEKFEAFSECLKSIVDLKEFMSYEFRKLQLNTVNDIIIQLKEENNFLKNEIKELRELVKNMVENITRQTKSTETVQQPENFKNNQDQIWKYVSRGPSSLQTSNEIMCSNRFDGLPHETNFYNNEDNDFEESNSRHVFKQNVVKKRPNPVINMYPERERVLSNKVGSNSRIKNDKKIRIISDSIPKGIRIKEFNRYVKNGSARIKSFPGTTIQQLNNYYSIPTLKEEKPEIVILHVGINDLLSSRDNITPEEEIATEIMKIGIKCKNHGVETVFISGITFCKNVEHGRIDRVNRMIKEESEKNGFIYINNDEINGNNVWKDGIHLEESGKVILANNFIDHINNFLGQKLLLPNQT